MKERDGPDFNRAMIEQPFVLVSLLRQIRERMREPKLTVPPEYYRGEMTLPITEMRPWYRDLPATIREVFAKPTEAIEIYNRKQEKKHLLLAAGGAILGMSAGWLVKIPVLLVLFTMTGYAAGRISGHFVFRKKEYPPDVWQDFRQQKVSWLNSVLIHLVALAALLMPFALVRWLHPPERAKTTVQIVDISPYLAELSAAAKKAGGGGGGGDRSPTPASKGAVPRFQKQQLAPPMAVILNPNPVLPVQPSLLGPPELKLPQMTGKMPWGDPQGVLGPPSNGPGFGGGIGTGEGTGIGSGKGGGLGPGEGGGTGGGPFSVGGSVIAPIPIYKPEPPYSEEARKAKYQGTVVLYIIVDAQGNVLPDVRVIKPLGLGLDEKAVTTVRTWKFKPAMREGIPVPVRVMVEVNFRLF